MDNRSIGVFDSGVGGLTVVKELQKILPAENMEYFGDLARLPYGNKSKENIICFSRQIIRFLIGRNVKMIVIACGTATSNALETIKSEFTIPIMGVVGPGAEAAYAASQNKRIGVIGTRATVLSGLYERLLKQKDPSCEVYSEACPLFVPLAEDENPDPAVIQSVAHLYMKPLCDAGVDTLVLGCTHYPLLKPYIASETGPKVSLINPSYETARAVKNFLKENDLEAERAQGHCVFHVTDKMAHFEQLAMRILDAPMLPVDVISPENL